MFCADICKQIRAKHDKHARTRQYTGAITNSNTSPKNRPPVNDLRSRRCNGNFSHPGVPTNFQQKRARHANTSYCIRDFWSFTGGRFFGLVLLFVIVSVYSRVRACLTCFALVCLHILPKNPRLIHIQPGKSSSHSHTTRQIVVSFTYPVTYNNANPRLIHIEPSKPTCLPTCLFVCVPAFLPTCLLACLLACLPAASYVVTLASHMNVTNFRWAPYRSFGCLLVPQKCLLRSRLVASTPRFE